MKIPLIPIGNSRGVRLPKVVLEQCGFSDAAEMTVDKGRIVLKPASSVRHGWAEAFAKTSAKLSREDREWLDAPLTGEDE